MTELQFTIPQPRFMITAMNERQKYGKLIADRRRELGMQAKDLAQVLGIATSTLSNIERGHTKYPPEPTFLRAIWRVLGLSMRTQLEELGYLDPEALEPGVAYVILTDDPRKKVLGLLEGASPTRVDGIADLTRLFLKVSLPAESDIDSDNRQDRDQPDSA